MPLPISMVACAIGAGIGLYDGFFGPGTGSFLVFLFVRVLGYDFLNASAGAKLINVFTNLAAIILFASKGHIWWHLGLTMAVANVIGSILGSRMALKHGAGFVRGAFMLVVSLLGSVISGIGALLCGIGVILTAPFGAILTVVAYRHMFEGQTAEPVPVADAAAMEPPPPEPTQA